MTCSEFVGLCIFWDQPIPSDEDLTTKESIAVPYMGIFYPQKEMLYEWDSVRCSYPSVTILKTIEN